MPKIKRRQKGFIFIFNSLQRLTTKQKENKKRESVVMLVLAFKGGLSSFSLQSRNISKRWNVGVVFIF